MVYAPQKEKQKKRNFPMKAYNKTNKNLKFIVMCFYCCHSSVLQVPSDRARVTEKEKKMSTAENQPIQPSGP